MALVAVAWAWGTALNLSGAPIQLGSPPLLGHWDLYLGPRLLLPIAAAVGAVWGLPRLVLRVSWNLLLAGSALGLAGWSVALALAYGIDGIVGPLGTPHEYLTAVPLVGAPGEFLSNFNDRIVGYATHVRGHPPAMVLVFWALAELGLGGVWPASLLAIAVGASAAPAALIAVREVADESSARRAAPFLVLAPAALWIATSADAFYMGIGAWGVALLVVAIHRDGRRSDLAALGGGLVLGVAIFLNYGLVLLGLLPLLIALRARRVRQLAIAAAAVAAVGLAFLAAGFWWIEGFFATREQYLLSAARDRPYGYFLLNNIAALSLALGPAAVVGISRLADRRLLGLVGGALAAVLLADLSGLSKAEVERIWLPFMPWLLLATACLSTRPPATRAWLAAQAAVPIAIVIAVRTPW